MIEMWMEILSPIHRLSYVNRNLTNEMTSKPHFSKTSRCERHMYRNYGCVHTIRIINRTSLVKRDHHTIKIILNSFLFNELRVGIRWDIWHLHRIFPIQLVSRPIHGNALNRERTSAYIRIDRTYDHLNAQLQSTQSHRLSVHDTTPFSMLITWDICSLCLQPKYVGIILSLGGSKWISNDEELVRVL